MKKLVLLTIILVSISGLVNAYTFYIDDDQARYNGYIESSISGAADPIIETNPGDPDPNMITLCGKQLNLEPASGGGGFFKLQDGPQKIPTDIQCSVGSKNVTVYSDDSNEFYPFEVNVDPFQMDSFYGEYLYLNGEADPSTINDFYLSNDNWGEDHSRPDPQSVYGDTDSAWVMVSEKDAIKKDDSAAYEASLGNRVGPDSIRINELIDDNPSAGNHMPGRTLATSTGGNFDDCEEGPCAMVNDIQFGAADDVEYNDVEIGSFGFFPESITSAHNTKDGGEYRLGGEIMVGSKPEHANGGPDQEGPYFFMCTQGATMDNGYEQVNRVIDIGEDDQDLMKCNPSAGEWEPVNECNDGLDNDGDSRIDAPGIEGNDTDCDGTTDPYGEDPSGEDPSGDPPSDCKVGAIRTDVVAGLSEDAIVAQHPTSSGCNTDGTIYATDEDVLNGWKTSIGANSHPQEYTCSNPYTGPGKEYCSEVALGDYGSEGADIQVAETVPERSYINQMLRLQDPRPGAENHKSTYALNDWTRDYYSLNPDDWNGHYKITDVTVDEGNNEITVDIDATLGSDATSEPIYPAANIRFNAYIGEASSSIYKQVRGQNPVNWDEGRQNIDVQTLTADYEEVRENGLTIRSSRILLYNNENPDPDNDQAGTGLENGTDRQISLTNYRKAAPMEYVNESGWKTDIQSLWEAEEKYKSGLDPFSYPGWESKNISEASVYDNNDLFDNEQAWEVANAGASNQLVDSRYIRSLRNSPNGRAPIFDGGFAPKCDEGQVWQYDQDESEWICSDEFNWEQTVQLPNTFDDSVIGLMLPPTNFMDNSELQSVGEWSVRSPDSYPKAVNGRESNFGANIDTVEATCWEGSLDEKSSAAPNEIISGSTTVSDSQVSGIYGEVDHSGTYSCEWNFTTTNGYVLDEASEENLIEMHQFNPINIVDGEETSEQITGNHWDFFSSLSWAYTDLNEFENQVGGDLKKVQNSN